MKTFKSWLWPDHVIGKRESRRLREEHNALLNEFARLHARVSDALISDHQTVPDKEDASFADGKFFC